MYRTNTASPVGAERTVPGIQALQLVELLKHWRIGAAELLAPLQLSERELEQPGTRLLLSTMYELIARTRTLTAEPALGVFMGLSRRVSNYGMLGVAATRAKTLREALELAVSFSQSADTPLALSLHVAEGEAILRIDERDNAGGVRDVVLLAFVIGLEQIGQALTRQQIPGVAHFAMGRPDYGRRFPDLFARALFDQPTTQMVFDAAALDLPVLPPDVPGTRLDHTQAEHVLREHGLDLAVVERVRRLICRSDGVRTLEEVAACLYVSSRTLKRRLAAHGVTFSQVLEDERCHRARFLLRASELSLEEISERLGYSSVPNFARAFRRWTGAAPASYRRSLLSAKQQPAASVPQASASGPVG